MSPVMVLLIAMLGPGQGPTASTNGADEGRDYYVIRRHSVDYEGLTFVVEGYQREDGKIVWRPDREYNRKAYAAAKAEHRLNPVNPPAPAEPLPTARPGPPPKARSVNGGHKLIKQDGGKAIKNYGLSTEHMGHPADGYHARGFEAKRFVAEAKDPASASTKFHITVIGSDEARRAVMSDLNSDLAFEGLRENLMIQDYQPGEWAIDPSLGFPGNGAPAIFVQTAKSQADPKGGRAVFQALDYSAGAAGLAGAIRKADPTYRPHLVPNINAHAGTCPLGFTAEHRPIVIVAAILLFLIHSSPRKGP